MTIGEAANVCENSRPGVMTLSEKIRTLSELDKKVCTEVFDRHEGAPVLLFEGYKITTPNDKELLIPDAFSDVYVRRLEAECDYKCADTEMYDNSARLFNSAWESFVSYWTATHKPLGAKKWRL